MLKINVGCGEFRHEDWINIDTYSGDEGPKPDIIASADDLPFTDGSVGRIYAGHVLEHIALDEIPVVLAEFERVLAASGGILIVGPDLTRAEQGYPEMVEIIKEGEGRWPGDKHLWHSREETVIDLLKENGWDTAAADIGAVYASNQWPITTNIGWQFAIFATKVPVVD